MFSVAVLLPPPQIIALTTSEMILAPQISTGSSHNNAAGKLRACANFVLNIFYLRVGGNLASNYFPFTLFALLQSSQVSVSMQDDTPHDSSLRDSHGKLCCMLYGRS
jgi:hypothetical protein